MYLPPKTLSEHPFEDPKHSDQGGVQSGVLPVDGDDKEVDMVAVAFESNYQLGDDVSIRVIWGIIKSYCVDEAKDQYVSIILSIFFLGAYYLHIQDIYRVTID